MKKTMSFVLVLTAALTVALSAGAAAADKAVDSTTRGADNEKVIAEQKAQPTMQSDKKELAVTTGFDYAPYETQPGLLSKAPAYEKTPLKVTTGVHDGSEMKKSASETAPSEKAPVKLHMKSGAF